MTPIKFAYFGTPSFSTLVLDELAAQGYTPALIVTTPDRPAGRGLALTASPVKEWALAHNINILQPEKFDAVVIAELTAGNFDVFIVAAYGKILPQAVLDIPRLGGLNVHPSLLPRYRGMSPVESQILADEKEIGVSVILMDAHMDHGPVVAQEKITIDNWPLSRNVLNELLWRSGGHLLATTLPSYAAGTLTPTPQDHSQATTTKKITKEDGLVELSKENVWINYLKYLAYEGWPGVYFFQDGERIKITKARFEHEDFVIERIIRAGKGEEPYQR